MSQQEPAMDNEILASHECLSSHREWHSVGAWLYPGERIVVQRAACGEVSSADSANPQGTQVASPAAALQTPRVDAMTQWISGHAIIPHWPSRGGEQEVVHADVARTFERELAASERQRDDHAAAIGAAEAELAALRKPVGGEAQEVIKELRAAKYDNRPLTLKAAALIDTQSNNLAVTQGMLLQSRSERDELQTVLFRHGFTRCDVAACNCGSWHHRYGLPERIQELKDLLDEAGHPLSNENGNLIKNALSSLIAERDAIQRRLDAPLPDVESQVFFADQAMNDPRECVPADYARKLAARLRKAQSSLVEKQACLREERQRAERAEKERDEAHSGWNDLIVRYAAMRKDAERLDWFERHGDYANTLGSGSADDKSWVIGHHDGNRIDGMTFREAIDAALGKVKVE